MSKQYHNIEMIAPLKENVIAVWSADIEQSHQITPDLLVPDGYIQLIFLLNGSYKRQKLSANHNSFVVNQSVIIGIQDTVIMSQNIGELKSIGLQFDPLQFYLLFGDLGIKTSNFHMPIINSNQSELIKLNGTISKTESITEALREIECFFTNYVPKIKKCDTWQLTKNSVQYIRKEKGNTNIEKIATSERININALRINFNNFIGYGPEKMIEIIKTHSNYSKPSINESTALISIKDLFEDMEENEES
jgi:hypothetical protein